MPYGDAPYGGGRRTSDERLYAWTTKFKLLKLRFFGSTTEEVEVHQCVDRIRARRHSQVIVPLDMENLSYAVGLAKELHGLGCFGRDGPEFDWDYCRSTMLGVMHDPNYYFRLALDDTGYVGAVCGKVVTFYFSPELWALRMHGMCAKAHEACSYWR